MAIWVEMNENFKTFIPTEPRNNLLEKSICCLLG